MADGSTIPVKVDGHWNEPVASYYKQKCQFGLYQALHRIRPHNKRDYDRHIFIFTNMPIPGVEVEGLLGKKVARLAKVIKVLGDQLELKGEITAPELAELVATSAGESLEALTRWVQRNVQRLAEDVGATLEEGKRGRPYRFVKAV